MKSNVALFSTGLILMAALLTGCRHATADTPSPPAATPIVATVNGQTITLSEFTYYKQERTKQMPDVKLSNKALVEEMVDMELLRQAAIKAGMAHKPQVQAQIHETKSNILIHALIKQKFGHPHFSEAALKKTYQQLVTQSGGMQYKARHILVKTRKEAEKIIRQLKAGANFVTLAKQDSTAPSAPQGGELGWFSLRSMVPHFSAAVAKLKKGQFTQIPVHTRFGWHIILLQDKRKLTPPPFDQIKPRIEDVLTQQAIENYVKDLRAKARIITKSDSDMSSRMNPASIKETTGESPTT